LQELITSKQACLKLDIARKHRKIVTSLWYFLGRLVIYRNRTYSCVKANQMMYRLQTVTILFMITRFLSVSKWVEFSALPTQCRSFRKWVFLSKGGIFVRLSCVDAELWIMHAASQANSASPSFMDRWLFINIRNSG